MSRIAGLVVLAGLLLASCAIRQFEGMVERSGPIPEYQWAMLTDGVVTPQEIDDAHAVTIDCLAGLDLDGLTILSEEPHWTGEAGSTLEWSLVTVSPPGVDADAVADAAAQQADDCGREHIWFLSAAWQDQQSFGEFAPTAATRP